MNAIYLSPSTQEHNLGAGNYTTEEVRMNELTDLIEAKLKPYKFKLCRNTPEMSLSQIVGDSNRKKPDIHVAIHSNAGNGKARGCEIWCHKFGGEGEKLARAIYKYIEPLTPSTDRGIKEGYNRFGIGKPLYETAHTTAPAVIIETIFHDNLADELWLLENMDSMAGAIVEGILEYFKVVTLPKVEQPAETEINYKEKYFSLIKAIEELTNVYKELK